MATAGGISGGGHDDKQHTGSVDSVPAPRDDVGDDAVSSLPTCRDVVAGFPEHARRLLHVVFYTLGSRRVFADDSDLPRRRGAFAAVQEAMARTVYRNTCPPSFHRCVAAWLEVSTHISSPPDDADADADAGWRVRHNVLYERALAAMLRISAECTSSPKARDTLLMDIERAIADLLFEHVGAAACADLAEQLLVSHGCRESRAARDLVLMCTDDMACSSTLGGATLKRFVLTHSLHTSSPARTACVVACARLFRVARKWYVVAESARHVSHFCDPPPGVLFYAMHVLPRGGACVHVATSAEEAIVEHRRRTAGKADVMMCV